MCLLIPKVRWLELARMTDKIATSSCRSLASQGAEIRCFSSTVTRDIRSEIGVLIGRSKGKYGCIQGAEPWKRL